MTGILILLRTGTEDWIAKTKAEVLLQGARQLRLELACPGKNTMCCYTSQRRGSKVSFWNKNASQYCVVSCSNSIHMSKFVLLGTPVVIVTYLGERVPWCFLPTTISWLCVPNLVLIQLHLENCMNHRTFNWQNVQLGAVWTFGSQFGQLCGFTVFVPWAKYLSSTADGVFPRGSTDQQMLQSDLTSHFLRTQGATEIRFRVGEPSVPGPMYKLADECQIRLISKSFHTGLQFLDEACVGAI